MTNMDPVMEPIFTKMIPCPGVGILKMIPCSAARPRTEKYMSTPPPGTGTFWKRHRVSTQKMIKQNIFQCFWNEADPFLECRYISLASKSCNEFFTVRFPPVFKLFRYRVNASSNFATVTFFTVFKMCRHCVNAVSVACNIRLIATFYQLCMLLFGRRARALKTLDMESCL